MPEGNLELVEPVYLFVDLEAEFHVSAGGWDSWGWWVGSHRDRARQPLRHSGQLPPPRAAQARASPGAMHCDATTLCPALRR